MYALPALTLTATEAVGARPYEPLEPGRRSHRVAAALERAARALAPRHPRPA